jgi:hypothetical protein
MPNRIIRDWTDSETVDKLSAQAERFFTRLIMKVDDYGRYSANIKLLKSALYPLKTDVRETDISLWLNECEQCGLIALYNIASKDYLQIENFKQVLRQKKAKYPEPDVLRIRIADDKQMRSNGMSETKRNEVESETETEGAGFVDEKFLIPEMLKEWKTVFTNYPEKKETDYPALLQIAQFLSEKEKIDCDVGVMPVFKQFILLVKENDFYKDKSLQTISRKIQDIIMKNGNSKTSNKSGSENLRQQVNEAFSRRYQ